MARGSQWLGMAYKIAILWAVLPGCAIAPYSGNTMNAAQPYVLTRATKDLACPTKKIAVRRELGGRYVASGCGKTAAYQSVCEQLQCEVSREGDEPPAWRDRPDPGPIETR